MKKIKLFSMLAAALFCGGTLTAQTVTTGDYSIRTISADGSTSTWDFTFNNNGSANINIKSTCTDNEIHYVPGSLNVNKAGYLSCKDVSSIYIPVPANSEGSIVMTCNGSTSGRYFQLYINDAVGTDEQRLNSNSAPQTLTFTSSDISTLDGVTYLHFKDNNAEMKVASFAVTLTTGAYIELTEPYLSISPAEVNLTVTSAVPSATASVSIKGGNLADGTYNLAIPSVEGLSVAPTSVEVVDGILDATVELTYTSDVNVAEGNAEVSLTIGNLTETVDVTYYARVSALEQTSVSEATTWDWANAGDGVTLIKLDDTTTPEKDEVVVLANVDGIVNNATFNSQALLVAGEYLLRDGKFCQVNLISFNVEKAGNIVVEFCNTGDRGTDETLRRYLHVNGVKTEFGSLVSNANTTSDAIAVQAGKVDITFRLPDATADTYCRVYSITYTPQEGATSVESATEVAPATKVVRNGQLLIIRDGKTYNAQGAVVR